MKSMHTLLDEAEEEWRDELKADYPLHADMPIVRRTEQAGRDWTFSTDLRTIFAHIGNDDSLRTKFEDVVTKYWDGNPEELARDVLHYLLFHELFHPLKAPFSQEDSKKIHQAIRRGVVKAEPNLSALEQLLKVQGSQNGVKDLILDNRFYLENQAADYVRPDIIPVWDLLEMQKEQQPKTTFYTATRLLYGLMYGPEKTHDFFQDKSGKDGSEVAEKAVSALLKRQVRLPRREGLIAKVGSLIKGSKTKVDYDPSEMIVGIDAVFAGNDRYAGIERLMGVLGPYVEKGMPKGRSDMQGEGTGGSPQNILEDLLEDMNEQEQEQFVNDLMNENPSALQEAAQQMSPSKRPASSSSIDAMKNLDVLAAHDFYKRNHPKVVIKGGKTIGESVVVGKQERWKLKRSSVLTQDDLSRINLRNIETMQRKTRLPWLIDIGNGTYRLNEYEIDSRPVKDVVYRELELDVPDVVEFYVDSSGSMGTGGFRVNDGSRWDMLSNVFYGFLDALRQAGQKVGKKTQMRIHNFANTQVDSTLMPVEQFWQGATDPLRVFFRPNNGYDQEDLGITKYGDGKKRAYVVVTDGDLVIPNRTERESAKMKELARIPSNSVLLFEIGGTYDLGQAVRSDPNVRYYPVHDKADMLKAGLEVLLAK